VSTSGGGDADGCMVSSDMTDAVQQQQQQSGVSDFTVNEADCNDVDDDDHPFFTTTASNVTGDSDKLCHQLFGDFTASNDDADACNTSGSAFFCLADLSTGDTSAGDGLGMLFAAGDSNLDAANMTADDGGGALGLLFGAGDGNQHTANATGGGGGGAGSGLGLLFGAGDGNQLRGDEANFTIQF